MWFDMWFELTGDLRNLKAGIKYELIPKGKTEVLTERIKELEAAWNELRPHLEQYNYSVGGIPTVIRAGIMKFEQH